MIPNKCENDSEQLTGYSNQSLYLRHPFFKMMQVLFMQYTSFSDHTDRGKKQKFSQKGPSPFRNSPLSFVLAGTDLKKVQPGMVDDLGDRAIFPKSPTSPIRPAAVISPIPFIERIKPAVRNFLQMLAHMRLKLFDVAFDALDGRNKLSYLNDHTVLSFSDSYRDSRCLIQGLSSSLPSFPRLTSLRLCVNA